MRFTTGFVPLLALLLLGPSSAQDAAPQQEPAPTFADAEEKLDDLLDEFAEAYEAWRSAARDASTPEERRRHEPLDLAGFAGRARGIAETAPGTDVAARACAWILKYADRTPHGDWALDTLAANHVRSVIMAEVCFSLRDDTSVRGEDLLRAIVAQNQHAEAQGRAKFWLAGVLQRLHAAADGDERALRSLGDDRKKQLAAPGMADALEKEFVALYEDVARTGGEIHLIGDTLLDTAAEGELFEWRHLRVGKTAPDIVGEDIDGTQFRLSDYRGKVILLDFWGHW